MVPKRTERPLGTDQWIEWLEKLTGRQLKPQKGKRGRELRVFGKLPP